MNEQEQWLGQILGGCRLDKLIGYGGMGVVYMAHQLSLDRTVAVKILCPKNFSTVEFEDLVRRFYREARLAAQLQHPNAVQIYDVGEENNTYFIVMQYIEGVDLNCLLKEKGRFSINDSVHVLKEVTKALIAAHKRHIIHRDIKPANIMRKGDHSIIVTDFGLARPMQMSSDLSTPGRMVGTLGYMSPEQAGGHADIDYRTDIYSLGATIYHLLTGHPPFEARTPVQLLYKHIKETPVDITKLRREIPRPLADTIKKMMERELEKRFASAQDVLNTLEETLADAIDAIDDDNAKRDHQQVSEREGTQLISTSLLSGEQQISKQVQRYLQLVENNKCQNQECRQYWQVQHLIELRALIFKKKVWCPRCLWEQFTSSLAGARMGQMETGSFGTYWLAIPGVDQYLAGGVPQIFYCFPMSSNKKNWETMLQRIERGFTLVSKINANSLLRAGNYTPVSEENIAYVPIEYTPSITLANLLEVRSEETCLPLEESLSILRKMAHALSVLHTRYIVHRNFTPNGVYIQLNGGLRLGNFTMAKSFAADQNSQMRETSLTFSEYWTEQVTAISTAETGSITTNLKSVVGTLAYMAPEQTFGSYNVDQRSDLWSWGAVAFELLEGKMLIAEKNPWEMVQEIREGELPKFSRPIPTPLQKIVYRAVERNINKRYQRASDITRALDLIKLQG